MTIEILETAEDDLVAGFRFYEAQAAGLGSYFLQSLYADIESLRLYAGVHRMVHRSYHRMLAHRFPCAIFYKMTDEMVRVYAIRRLSAPPRLDPIAFAAGGTPRQRPRGV